MPLLGTDFVPKRDLQSSWTKWAKEIVAETQSQSWI
jgi:hypothetical protein